MKIKMLSTNQDYIVEKVGVFTPKPKDIDVLKTGEIGFITTGIKVLSETKVGDTICDALKPNVEASTLGFKASQIVSPTFVSDNTFIPVVIKPISPVFNTSISLGLGVNTPTFSTI